MSLSAFPPGPRSTARWFCACVALLGAFGLTGCEKCVTEHNEAVLPLDDDEMGVPCDQVCGEVLNILSDYDGCQEGVTKDGAPAVICFYQLEVCPSNSL